MSQKKDIQRILELLAEGNFSGQEISSKLEASYGGVRAVLSFLKQLGFIEPVPKEKRGKPYRLTDWGKEYLKKVRKGRE